MNSMPATADRIDSRGAARAEGQTRSHSPFLPLLLMGVALLGWMAFQTVMLMQDRGGLHRTLATQQAQVTQSTRLRAALSSLASDTQKLADTGDPGAQLIVNQLRQHGITIHPDAAAPAAP